MKILKVKWYNYSGVEETVSSPGAVILLKVGSSQPDALLTGKRQQSMSIDGPGTLQSSMGHTLKHNIRHGVCS